MSKFKYPMIVVLLLAVVGILLLRSDLNYTQKEFKESTYTVEKVDIYLKGLGSKERVGKYKYADIDVIELTDTDGVVHKYSGDYNNMSTMNTYYNSSLTKGSEVLEVKRSDSLIKEVKYHVPFITKKKELVIFDTHDTLSYEPNENNQLEATIHSKYKKGNDTLTDTVIYKDGKWERPIREAK